MSQPRHHSIMESVANTASGFAVSWCVWQAIGPLYGIELRQTQDLSIVGIFTVASLIRSYAWRRAFNRWRTQ